MSTQDTLPTVVIGAGPVGLAAAAHLAERGLDFLVLESGDGPAAAMAAWGHVRVFSPWRYNIDAAARRLLEADGWIAADLEGLPLGSQIVADYLQPLTKLPALAEIPVAIVDSESSLLAGPGPATVAFLRQAGCRADRIALADHGVHGNGHLMMLERNNREVLEPILRWLDDNLA